MDQYTTASTRAGRTTYKLVTTFLQHVGIAHHLRVNSVRKFLPATMYLQDSRLEGAWEDAKSNGLTPLNGEHKEANRDVAIGIADSLT